MAVPADDLSSLGTRGEAPRPALVHGVARLVVDSHDHGGVTGDPLHRLDVDQAVDARALPASSSVSPDSSTRASRGTWATTKNGVGRRGRIRAVPPAPGPATDARSRQVHIPMNPSQRRWSKGVSSSEGRSAAQASTQALVRGVVLGWAAGRDMVRCPSLKRRYRLSCSEREGTQKRTWPASAAVAGDLDQLTDAALLGLVAELSVGLAGWPRRRWPAPCQRRSRPHRGPHQVRQVLVLLTDVAERPGRRHRDTEALGHPGLRRGRPFVSERLCARSTRPGGR